MLEGAMAHRFIIRALVASVTAVVPLVAASPAPAEVSVGLYTIASVPDSGFDLQSDASGDAITVAYTPAFDGLAVSSPGGVSSAGGCVADGPTRVVCPHAALSYMGLTLDGGADSLDLDLSAIPLPAEFAIGIEGGGGKDAIAVQFRRPARRVSDVTVQGDGGDDAIRLGPGGAYADGGPGADLLRGGSDFDHLFGDEGSDRLFGGPGPDLLRGGERTDVLRAGLGRDRIQGGTDDDRIYGGPGDDEIEGSHGNDFAFGAAGDDRIFGWTRIRRVGGRDRDRLFGGRGGDYLAGGPAPDLHDGGRGSDRAELCPRRDTFRAIERILRFCGASG
jgi:hypothetical protein